MHIDNQLGDLLIQPRQPGGPGTAVFSSTRPFDHDTVSAPLSLIRLLVLAIAPFILIDAALYQLQMFVTGGATPITPAILKMGLLGAFAAAFLSRGRVRDCSATRTALVFVAYLVFVALHQYFNLDMDLVSILMGYNAYYLLPLLGVIALCIPMHIPDRILLRLCIFLFCLCGLLGLAQYVTNSPIVPTFSSDGYFRVMVWSSVGHIRVFSLFVAPAACSAFFGFIASLAVAMCAKRRNLIYALPLLCVSLFLSWATDARTNIIGAVCAVVTSWVITFSSKKDRSKWLPFLWLSVGIVVAIYAYSRTLNSGFSTGGITDSSSFAERFSRWADILEMFRTASLLNLAVGYGLVQGAKFDTQGVGGSDNFYLALILHVGVIGLALALALLWNLWKIVCRQAETRSSYVTTAVASTYSTLLLAGLFDIGTFGMFLLIFAISDNAAPQVGRAMLPGLVIRESPAAC